MRKGQKTTLSDRAKMAKTSGDRIISPHDPFVQAVNQNGNCYHF